MLSHFRAEAVAVAETGVRSGEMVQGRAPEWQPLLNLAGEEITGGFMWMYEVRFTGGDALHAYKHRDTRRYVHLDLRGCAYAYEGDGGYRPLPAAEALADALRLPRLRYTPL